MTEKTTYNKTLVATAKIKAQNTVSAVNELADNNCRVQKELLAEIEDLSRSLWALEDLELIDDSLPKQVGRLKKIAEGLY